MRGLTFGLVALTTACVSVPEPIVWDGSVQELAIKCLDRHDAYFPENETAMADSAMARMLLPDAAAVPFLLSCLDRHDAAVQADAMLTPLERDSFLASSALLREYAAL
jgi:hypothetical protein